MEEDSAGNWRVPITSPVRIRTHLQMTTSSTEATSIPKVAYNDIEFRGGLPRPIDEGGGEKKKPPTFFFFFKYSMTATSSRGTSRQGRPRTDGPAGLGYKTEGVIPPASCDQARRRPRTIVVYKTGERIEALVM